MAKPTHFQVVSDEIAEGMARALWVTAYANFFDEPGADEDRYINFARAGAGEDWDDVAPETPEAAVKAAQDLEALFAAKNDFSPRYKRQSIHPTAMHMLYTRALEAKPKGATSPYEFGFLMAMQALGEGVSWFDDHPKFDVEFPRFQTYFDGDDLIWSGEGSHKNPKANDALDVPGVTNPAIRAGVRVKTPFGNGVVMKTKASKNIPGGRLVTVMLEGEDEAFENIPIDQVTAIGPHSTSFAARRGNPSAVVGQRVWTPYGSGVVKSIKESRNIPGAHLVSVLIDGDDEAYENIPADQVSPIHSNPVGMLTAKGERMYEEIRRGYEEKGEPRAAEIAMRTVYAKAKEGVTGLLRVGRGRPPGVPSKGE